MRTPICCVTRIITTDSSALQKRLRICASTWDGHDDRRPVWTVDARPVVDSSGAVRLCDDGWSAMSYKTIEEAAAVLRKGKRWLESWLRGHPVDRAGEPYYHYAGRTKLFTDHDIDRIRENLPCPS